MKLKVGDLVRDPDGDVCKVTELAMNGMHIVYYADTDSQAAWLASSLEKVFLDD